MSFENNSLVYITVKNEKEGMNIAKLAIEGKLAACANLYPKIQSIYEWNNQIQIDKESVLILKTKKKKYKELEKLIIENHSYDIPCILLLPIDNGYKNFMNWIEERLD